MLALAGTLLKLKLECYLPNCCQNLMTGDYLNPRKYIGTRLANIDFQPELNGYPFPFLEHNKSVIFAEIPNKIVKI